MLKKFSLAIVLFIIWLLLSGHFEPLLIWLGIASCILVVLIAHRMDLVDHEGHPIHLGWRAITYVPWLSWEIIKANIDVARIILDPKLPISPVLFRTPASQRTELGQVIYANSITLTPGTVSVATAHQIIDVHALTEGAAQEVESQHMDKRAAKMEGHMEEADADTVGGTA